MDKVGVGSREIDELYEKLDREAEESGYHLNPNREHTRILIEGILVNEKRYGYGACPCRLATGARDEDLDIICPCDYRDPDLTDYDTCYCALYVSEAALKGGKEIGSIPERRPPAVEGKRTKDTGPGTTSDLPLPVWRCRVCGYLCARESPPEVCPICKVNKERFERFM
jgi:ferredoxin-thioredoxin reductase catalytic subunit